MRALANKLKPAVGFSYYLHVALRAMLPVLVLIFVRGHFEQVAIVVVLLSKWRMLVIRPRYWAASIRSNAIDIIVGVSFTIFMAHAGSGMWQLVWAVAYGVWLVALKPQSGVLMVSLQAFVGQLLGLVALFIGWPDAPLAGYVFAVWLIDYLAARHFFTSFEESYSGLYASFWAYFSGALMWVLGHWLLFYRDVSQPTLLLGVLGFSLGGLYYLDERDRLSPFLRRQFIFIMIALIVVVLAFSDWGDKTI
jgi:hypothetical protein